MYRMDPASGRGNEGLRNVRSDSIGYIVLQRAPASMRETGRPALGRKLAGKAEEGGFRWRCRDGQVRESSVPVDM